MLDKLIAWHQQRANDCVGAHRAGHIHTAARAADTERHGPIPSSTGAPATNF
jgi:hypothetical protein